MITKQVMNHLELNIGTDFSKACDKFGYKNVKQYSAEYRENAERVLAARLSFFDWCKMRNRGAEGFSFEDAIKHMKKTYTPGTRVKLVYAQHNGNPPIGSKGSVISVTDEGNIEVEWDAWKRSYSNVSVIVFGADSVALLTPAEIKAETFSKKDAVAHSTEKCLGSYVCYTCARRIPSGETINKYTFEKRFDRICVNMCEDCASYIRNHNIRFGAKSLKDKFGEYIEKLEGMTLCIESDGTEIDTPMSLEDAEAYIENMGKPVV